MFAGLVFSVYREGVLGPFLGPVALLTAKVTAALVSCAGMDVVRAGTVPSHPGRFAYEVAYTLVGFLPVVFAASTVLSYRVRPTGPTFVIPLLLTLNLGRLVHRFHLGLYERARFDCWHEDLWPGIIRLTIIVLWVAWACWAERSSRRDEVASSSPDPVRVGSLPH